MLKSIRAKLSWPVVSSADDINHENKHRDEEKPQNNEPEFKIDENFHICHVSGCDKAIPCDVHQQGLLLDKPELFFMSIVQNSSGPERISSLLRWAYWTLKNEASEGKWEVALSLQVQALAVHYHEPRVTDEDYNYNEEAKQQKPREPNNSLIALFSNYNKEKAKFLAKRQQQSEARQARQLKRTHQNSALESIWKQIYQLTCEFFAFEEVKEGVLNWDFFMKECIDLRQKLAYSPGRRLLRLSTENQWVSQKAEISHYYMTTLKTLVETCLEYANVAPEDTGVMLLGSLARAEGMPFSDVEFAVVLGNRALEKHVWKAIRIFRFLVILLGETPYGVLQAPQARMFSTKDKKAWSFIPLGLHVDNGARVIVDESAAIVALQGEGNTDIVTRTALRQVSFLCGNPSLVQQYKSALNNFWTSQLLLRQETAKDLLTEALQKFNPRDGGDVCSLKSVYHMLSLGLEALGMWYGLYAVGCMNMISLLRSKGILQYDTAARVGKFLDLLMGLRMSVAQLSFPYQNDHISKVNGAWSPLYAQLIGMASEFHAGGVKYVQKLAADRVLPTTMLKTTLAIKSTIFTLEITEVAFDKIISIIPVSYVKEEEPKNAGGISSLSNLLMIKDYLHAFMSLASRMSLGSCCKDLRIVSPGPVTTIRINSTADAQMFLDGPPTLGSHILRLEGSFEILFRSKQHATFLHAWTEEDTRRKEEMKWEHPTLSILMRVRAHHRVVGLHFSGYKAVTKVEYRAFWAYISPYIGWLCISDQSNLDQYKELLQITQYRGSYFKISGSGNCWQFLLDTLNGNSWLEGISLSWRIDHRRLSSPKRSVPSLHEFDGASFYGLQYVHVDIPSNEGQPNNNKIVYKWLLEKSNLRKFSARFEYQGAEREWKEIFEFVKNSSRLQELHVALPDYGALPKLLNGLQCERFQYSGGGYDTGVPTNWFMNTHVKHLDLGAYRTNFDGLVPILKAFPQLRSFAVDQTNDLTPAHAPLLAALLPYANTIRIFQGFNTAILVK